MTSIADFLGGGRPEENVGGGQKHDPDVRMFGSDNMAGVHPEVMEAIAAANGGHVSAYGDDPYTKALQRSMQSVFGPSAMTVPVFNGTGANVVALEVLTQRWEAVVCARSAHINTDECGAPERISGIKLLPVDTPDGKLTPDLAGTVLGALHGEHNATPSVVSVSQSTEYGTVYSVDELSALIEHAHAHGLRVHVDGARLANAAVALGVSLKEMTADLGVDVISLGGTKNGLMGAEALVILDPVVSASVRFVRKYTAQLASKMRFTSAQLLALYGTDLWERNARNANDMAALLTSLVRDVPGVTITQEPQANAVFATLPRLATVRLRRRWGFHEWDAATGEVRWMTSWDTTKADVEAFAQAIREAVA